MVTRLSGGITPADGSDPRTFPTIWNETATTIESQGSAITTAESDIDTLQSDVTANGTAITALQSDVSTIQGWDLTDLGDVSISGASSGEILEFDGTNWVNAAAGAAGGKILQVVSTTKTNSFSASGSSFVDVTGMSASITPSATSSKVLVLVNMMTSSDATSADYARLVRNGTAIAVGSSGDGYWVSNTFSASDGLGLDMPVTFLDSPSSTSSLTYKIQIGGTNAASTRFVNRRGVGSTPVAVSSITLMEVGA